MSTKSMRRRLAFESLETRRVLTAGMATGVCLADGVLTIQGTNKNDQITVCLAGEMGEQLSVHFGKSTQLFNLVDVTELHISGNNGNDRIRVGEGVAVSTFIDGGRGNDWLWGGGGADVVHGGAGNDHVYGGGGDDELHGDAGNDKVWGSLGVDHLFGEAGHDHLHGGDGDDFAWGGDHKDHLFGDAGNDQLFGEGDKDLVYGNDGDDWLDGGDNKDHLWGGLGNDSIKGGWGNDLLNGGEGTNLLDGDEGFNHLWNGTETDLDAPQPPEDPEDPPSDPGDPEVLHYVTTLDDGVYHATLDFSDDGTEKVLTLSFTGPATGDMFLFMIEGNVWDMFSLDTGSYSARYSSLHDDAGEMPFPDSCVLVNGAEVTIGSLVGPLNLSVAS